MSRAPPITSLNPRLAARTWVFPVTAGLIVAAGYSIGLVAVAHPPSHALPARAPWASEPGQGQQAPAAGGDRPSIVLILTDDQRWDMLGHMPNVRRLLVAHGVNFANGFVVNPMCCPSRTTILTGQYSHSTGVYAAGGPYGGYRAFHGEQSTVATWLHDAGYRTALVGKYINGYAGTRVPPGWDRWFAFEQNASADYYFDYRVNDQGVIRSFGTSPQDYSTDVLDSEATRFIKTTNGPLFLYLAPYAPHGPATPAPRDRAAFPHMEPARPPSYDEADVSDKPAWVRALPTLPPAVRENIDERRVNRYRALLAVDRMVGDVVRALAAAGRLHDTMIVFTSDNGLAWGEHRWDGKEVPYEESIRVPMVVRDDAIVSIPRTDRHLVLNLDLAPTFAEVADVGAPGADGQSVLPLLAWPGAPWRSDFLIEHVQFGYQNDPPTYCAVRTTDYLYVQYEGGDEELYDLRTDPYELRNVLDDPARAGLLEALRLRTRDLCAPPPPGFTFSH